MDREKANHREEAVKAPNFIENGRFDEGVDFRARFQIAQELVKIIDPAKITAENIAKITAPLTNTSGVNLTHDRNLQEMLIRDAMANLINMIVFNGVGGDVAKYDQVLSSSDPDVYQGSPYFVQRMQNLMGSEDETQ